MRILFTSASSPTALALARVLTAEGHTVHAADIEQIWGTAPARYSRAYRRFHRLTGTWSAPELWKAIGDNIDLVIPFGPLPGRFIESLQSRGANIVGETLTQDDHEFQDFVRDNIVDASSEAPSIVKVPASFTVHSHTCIAEILSNRKSKFSLKPLPCYDTDDEDTLVDVESATTSAVSRANEPTAPLILSCSTLDDNTVETIKRLPMSDTKPYRLIEVAEGGSFYSAHAFVHAGQIRSFVVTNSRSTDRDFVMVGTGEPLHDVLYQFTRRLVDALNGWQTVVANHLSLTFHVLDKVRYADLVRQVLVVSCHNEPHASLVLLAAIPELRQKLALAYTSSTLGKKDCVPVQFPTEGKRARALYSASLAATEFARILFGFRPWQRNSWVKLAHMVMLCWVWVMNFKEEMWETSDPVPALCYWVVMIVDSLVQHAGRVVDMKSAVKHVASLHSKGLLLFRMVSAVLGMALDIWRWSFAVLLQPWYRKTQR